MKALKCLQTLCATYQHCEHEMGVVEVKENANSLHLAKSLQCTALPMADTFFLTLRAFEMSSLENSIFKLNFFSEFSVKPAGTFI